MRLTRRNVMAAGAAFFAPALEAGYRPKRPTNFAEAWARTELYFGTNRPGAEPISETQFSQFVDYNVTERFPDGLTLLSADGQFRSSSGELIREKSFLLILFYPRDFPDANKKIQEIREQYKAEFQQESVLRVDSLSLVSF